ncbi:hypothetical protein ACNPNP_19660 [Microbacterium sp. AGC85]
MSHRYRDAADPLDHWSDEHWTNTPARLAAYEAETEVFAALMSYRSAMHPSSFAAAVADIVETVTAMPDCDCGPEDAP